MGNKMACIYYMTFPSKAIGWTNDALQLDYKKQTYVKNLDQYTEIHLGAILMLNKMLYLKMLQSFEGMKSVFIIIKSIWSLADGPAAILLSPPARFQNDIILVLCFWDILCLTRYCYGPLSLQWKYKMLISPQSYGMDKKLHPPIL